MKDYIIQFSGLKEGIHTFDFRIGKMFFDHFDHSEITECDIALELELEKRTRMLILNFRFQGSAQFPCDRCGDPLDQPITGADRLIIKFGPEPGEESEEVIILPEKEHKVDVSHYIYEFLTLHVPARRVHGEDENGESLCNHEVISRLEEHSGEQESDPRWDALKKLKNKKNN